MLKLQISGFVLLGEVPWGGWGFSRGAAARAGALSPLAQPVTVIVGVGGAQGVP